MGFRVLSISNLWRDDTTNCGFTRLKYIYNIEIALVSYIPGYCPKLMTVIPFRVPTQKYCDY